MFRLAYELNLDIREYVLYDPVVLADSVFDYTQNPSRGLLMSNVVEFL